MEIEEIRRAVLATIESIAPETDVHGIGPDQPLRQQIELDSMDWLNVITGLHDRLSIEVPESDFGRLTTLDSIVAYVASRQAEHSPAPWAATTEAPAQLSCTRHLVNGTLVVVRPIRHDDMPLEADFVRHLSKETRYKRFMETLRELPQAELIYLTDVDQIRHVALVATAECQGQQFMVGRRPLHRRPRRRQLRVLGRCRRCLARLRVGRHPDACLDGRCALPRADDNGGDRADDQRQDAEIRASVGVQAGTQLRGPRHGPRCARTLTF